MCSNGSSNGGMPAEVWLTTRDRLAAALIPLLGSEVVVWAIDIA